MKEIFELKETNRNLCEKCRLNLNIPDYNQFTSGKKCLRVFGPKIWNSLPYHIKSSKNLETFKTVIKNWDGVNCKCVICKKLLTIYLFVFTFLLFLTVIFIHLMSVSSVLISDCISCKYNSLSLKILPTLNKSHMHT